MADGTRSIDAPMTPKRRLTLMAIGALYLVVTGAALEVVGMLVGNPMSATLLGALVVAVIISRARLDAEEHTAGARKRALVAGGATAAVIALVVVVALASGAKLLFVPPAATALFGVAEAFALAYVGELWLHGLPLLFAKRARVSLRYAYPYAVLAGLAPTLLVGGMTPATLVVAAASGAFFTALWVRSGDSWAPIAAHFVFAWGVDSLLAGDLLHLSSAAGRFMHGPGSQGLIAWLGAAGFTALTLLVLLNKLTFVPATIPDAPDGEA
jgi:hypothetical protein